MSITSEQYRRQLLQEAQLSQTRCATLHVVGKFAVTQGHSVIPIYTVE